MSTRFAVLSILASIVALLFLCVVVRADQWTLPVTFSTPDSDHVDGCKAVQGPAVQRLGDSLTVGWRAFPLNIMSYMHAVVDSTRLERGARYRLNVPIHSDTTYRWIVAVWTAQVGWENGQPKWMMCQCQRGIIKTPALDSIPWPLVQRLP
jgi:hypothetical protein